MSAKKNKQEVTESARADPLVTFSKDRILSMPRYRARRDLLLVLLEDGKSYTLEEVYAAIKDFTEGKGN